MPVSRCVCLTVCLSVHLGACLFVCLSACVPVSLFVCSLAFLSGYLPICLSVCKSICLSECPFVCGLYACHHNSLCPGTSQNIRPLIGIVERGGKLLRKVGISYVRWKVISEIFHNICIFGPLPGPPHPTEIQDKSITGLERMRGQCEMFNSHCIQTEHLIGHARTKLIVRRRSCFYVCLAV